MTTDGPMDAEEQREHEMAVELFESLCAGGATGLEDLIERTHAEVDAYRAARGLPPWNWNAVPRVRRAARTSQSDG